MNAEGRLWIRFSPLVCTVGAAGWLTFGSAGAFEAGRMTGEGAFFCPYLSLQRVTHAFELNCATGSDLGGREPTVPNKLEIGLSGGAEFHLTRLTRGLCSAGQAVARNRPVAMTETFRGEGAGTFNGLAASITFAFTDAGEPGTDDTAEFVIKLASSGATVLECKPDLPLILGKHRAYKPGNETAEVRSATTEVQETAAIPAPRDAGGAVYSPFAPLEGKATLNASLPPRSSPKGSSATVVVFVGSIFSGAVAAGLGFLAMRWLRAS